MNFDRRCVGLATSLCEITLCPNQWMGAAVQSAVSNQTRCDVASPH